MRIRNCSGGVVFYDNRVLLMQNEKGEWEFPKGLVKASELSGDVAVYRVKYEAGVDADVLTKTSNTNYEFFSISRQTPICNRITWYIMEAKSDAVQIGESEKCKDCGFYTLEDAMEKITFSQDKSLLKISYEKYKEIIGR